MKKLPLVFVCLVVLMIPLGMFVKSVYALERTIDIDGVNYVSLTQMGKKYNLAVKEEGGVVTLTGEAVNLSVGVNSNMFTLNGIDYVAQEVPQRQEDTVWISAKDWASMFNLSLTHYDKVSEMAPVNTEPASTEAVLDTDSYRVGDDWGDKVPEGIRKHGSINSINSAHIKTPIYETKHYNVEKEETPQSE